MSKEEIKSILIDLICDYDPKRWSNEDVYCKYADLLYDKIENSNYELKGKYLNISHIDQMKKIADLEAKLAEKDAELIGRKKLCDLRYKQLQEAHQDKISFCIEKLVDIQKHISDNPVGAEQECFGREINEFIDNQIEKLKKEMK